ncbi:histidine phosphatase family protein [Mesobacillus maritimus]|uniref:histidine phosphatase family protein n=1 Tax=Mesobacillus maritimus TaxID=1643336 RepID=UPI002041CC20|nr:histidine phosphatase family protein [Mesobacillus maritimus]MCM3671664.1 histidine phosphatase family protein [Mesobacillus maritimus]
MNIYVIRHGESEHNVDRTVMSHTHDSQHSLTEKGQKQVQLTGEFMRDQVNENTVLYASPYLRTMQTAEAIHSRLPEGVPFYQNPLIREWELGNLYDFTNRTPEAKREFKAAGQFYFRYQNGESLADVYLRATMFMSSVVDRVKQQGRYENLLIVSHAAFMQMLLAFLMNWPVDELEGFKPIENASVLKINEVNGDYQYEKIYIPSV